jgi:subfamily B ATP-binding cassette protein MsbA
MSSQKPPAAAVTAIAADAAVPAADAAVPAATAAVPAATAAAVVAPPKRPFFESWQENWPFFSKLGAYLKPYKTRFLLGQLCGVCYAFFNGMLPLLTNVVLTHTVPAETAKHAHNATKSLGMFGHMSGYLGSFADGKWGILFMCALIPAVMILRGLFDYLNAYSMAWVSLKVLGDMRRKLFTHIAAQSLQFFHFNRSGHLISRVANDTRVAQTALSLIGADLIKQPFCVFVGVYTLIKLDPKFTVMALVLFPLCIVPVAIYGRRIRKSGRKEEEMAGAMTSILQETFAGIRVIKSFAREDFQVAQFEESNIAQFRNAMRVRKATEIVGPMVEVVAAMGVGLALFYVHHAGMPLSKFISLVMGLFLLYNPIKQLSRMHMLIQKCRAATMHIFDLMDLQPDVQDVPGAVDLTKCRGEISFQQVHFYYPGNTAPALEHFDQTIKAGKYIALVGASGAGKSTVLGLLQRFYDPTHGSITIDGQDLRTYTQKSLREQIGVVTQDTFLFHDTIYKNIQYGRLDATKKEIIEAAKQAYAHDFILGLPQGYETRVGDKGCRLSGGQQQRLAIARALLKNAPILLLDEATSALDTESEQMIQRALEKLVVGRTVIAIAHRLSTILKADRILVMDNGRIVEKGNHARLYANNGRYRRLYDLQFDHEAHMPAVDLLPAPGSEGQGEGNPVSAQFIATP